MATLITGNGNGKYHDSSALHDVITYVLNTRKAPNYFGGFRVDRYNPIEDMQRVTEMFDKTNGVQLRHFIISFSPEETRSASIVNDIACMIVPYLGREYQTVFAVHEDTTHLHIHIVCNAISYLDGHRYRGSKKEFYDFICHCNQILRMFRMGNLRYVSNKQNSSYIITN
jgi:hypothetical protein